MIGWAILELFGHVRLVGEVSEVDLFGSKMGRILVLGRDGERREQFFGGGSVYRLTPVSEEEARAEISPYDYASALEATYSQEESGAAVYDHGDEEEVDARFVPRRETLPVTAPRSSVVRFGAWTTDRGHVEGTPLKPYRWYAIVADPTDVLGAGEKVDLGVVAIDADGNLRFLVPSPLRPSEEYWFEATPAAAPDDAAIPEAS